MKKIRFYLIFYKSKFAFPLFLSVFLLFKSGNIGITLFTLLFSTLALFFYERFLGDPKKKELYFFFNQGISVIKLYGFTLLLNALFLTILFNFLR